MKHRLFFSFLILLPLFVSAQYDAQRYPIIPKPYSLLPFSSNFTINAETVIITDNRFYRNDIEHFRKQVLAVYGINLPYGKGKYSNNFIYISEDSLGIPKEGYNLYVTKNEINLYGGHAGIFYGLQTLLQLIHPNDSNSVNSPGPTYSPNSKLTTPNFIIPSCAIIDQPRFAWRGMHLDVARHFFSKDSVKEYLRYMAMYKLNTFHWHLTDDQGWRIEIKKYPKLTSVGAQRSGTKIGHANGPGLYDMIPYGGYYTQDDVREIVKFADSLHITIVPEIEMPGHALAILAAYPEFGCGGEKFEVCKTWGVFDDVLCPTEQTFSFLDDVLKEVCALFPGKYIHIGGDECPKTQWKTSAYCQELMKKNKLKDENELQGWFTQRIVKMLQQKGKQAIGWDEILDGGLAEGAAVMSWRGEEGGIAAAKAKHNAVMSPGSHCYFDHYQSQHPGEPLAIGGFLPLEKVYSYDPVPAALNAEERKYIIGVQANLWTEYIPTFSHVQYMIFPRIAALAEVAWTEPINKDFDFFMKRLMPHLSMLEKMKVNYAKSIFEIHTKLARDPNGEGLLLTLSTLDKNLKIGYTVSEVDTALARNYTGPLHIYPGMEIHAQAYDTNGKWTGKQLDLGFNYNLALAKPVLLRKPPSESYNTGGDLTLVDGIRGGGIPWLGSEWLGFSGDTLDATIDLGSVKKVNQVTANFLQDKGSWIHAPGNFNVYYSIDGKTFSPLGANGSLTEDLEGLYHYTSIAAPGTQCRYLKIVASSTMQIPPGNAGEGKPAWLFVSEIEVK
jgi:hexosaminidase